MRDIATKSNTKEIIERHGFTFKKSFGQNFLTDTNILNKIVNAADLTDEVGVIEIGPGIGALTEFIARKAKKVVAYEIDPRLIPILAETLAPYDNVKVIHQDILKADVASMIEEEFKDVKEIAVVANLPYYITTPIIMGLFESEVPLDSITVMVQKEVADRMQVGPGTKDYGALSLAVQYYAEPYIVANVPPNCFIPRPAVGSAVIRLTRYQEKPVKVNDASFMFKIIRASFNQRRKTLQNGLYNSSELRIPKEKTVAALEEMGLTPTNRGETLALEEFAQLSHTLGRYKHCCPKSSLPEYISEKGIS